MHGASGLPLTWPAAASATEPCLAPDPRGKPSDRTLAGPSPKGGRSLFPKEGAFRGLRSVFRMVRIITQQEK